MEAAAGKSEKRLNVRHPLIRAIADMTFAATGIELTVVYPEQSGWGQSLCGSGGTPPAFCGLIKGGTDGAKHCSMCHVLMAVAACSGEPVEQRCHAGAAVIVQPAGEADGETVAVLSSCMYAPEDAWEEVRQRGIKLGINLNELRKAFLKLRRLNDEQMKLLKAGMKVMGEAIQSLRENLAFQERIMQLSVKSDPVKDIEALLEKPDWAGRPQRAKGKPLLIHVVCQLARQRPDLPLSVKELAAAAHLTPNHFTTLFHEHAGMSFNDYLTDLRVKRAKKLLGNPLLNINEIARLSGYDDAGYFARRFRQKTGLTPREWRNRRSLES